MTRHDQAGHEERIGLLEELRRRKVVRVGLAYLMASWLLLQVADVVAPLLDVSESTVKLLFRLLVLGFPIALLLSWAFELTPTGIRTTRRARREFGEAQHEEGIQQRRNRFAYLTGIAAPALLIGITLGAAAVWTLVRPPDEPASPGITATIPTIAVLPFRNMSPDPENAFFADGVHEEILTRLSRLAELRVISRTSVMQFADEVPSLPEVARMLNASHVVEGSVRRAGDTVRITAQLIDAATDKHLWAETFDRELKDIFEIQAQVAGQITRALETRLSPAEEAILEDATPRNLEAFDLYTQARLAAYDIRWTGASHEDRLQTIGLLERAVEIDPEFAEAWQLLSRTKCFLVFHDEDPDGQLLAGAEHALSRARDLASDTTETLAAQAIFLYQCKRQLEPALEIMRQVRKREPKRSEWAFVESWILRRLGRWDEMLASMGQAVRLDPLSSAPARAYAVSLRSLGRYEEAYQAELRYRRLEPGRWDDLILGMDRIAARPDYAEWTALLEHELGRVEESDIPIVPPDVGATDGISLLKHLFLTGRGAEAWRLNDREPGEIVPGTIRDMSLAYYQMRILDFLGRPHEARRLAEKALGAQAGLGDHEMVPFGKAVFGGYVGEGAIAQEGLAVLRRQWTQAPDAFLGRINLYRYVEALLLSDPELAKEAYLDAPRDMQFLTPGDFGVDTYLWYRFLDYPEFREQLRDYPQWIRFIRDGWPEGRPFPFDAPEVLARSDE